MPYIDLPIPVNTSEDIQDVIGAMIAAGTGISVDYNDNANTLTITNTASASGVTREEAIAYAIALG
jgi:hypothetical protein